MAGGFKSIPFEACTHATIGAWTWTTTYVDLGAPSWKSPELLSTGRSFCDNGQFERQFISIELFGMWRQDETGRAFEKGVPIPFGGLGWYLKHLKTVLHVAYYPPYITVLATQLCCFFELIRAAILVATLNGGRFSISKYFTSFHHVSSQRS